MTRTFASVTDLTLQRLLNETEDEIRVLKLALKQQRLHLAEIKDEWRRRVEEHRMYRMEFEEECRRHAALAALEETP